LRAERAWYSVYIYRKELDAFEVRSKRARRRSEKADRATAMKFFREKLAELEETAARHERLARYYGNTAAVKRPEP
jgi:hypothetical protein